MFKLAPLIIFFPILALLVNALFGRRFQEPAAGVIASAATGLSFVIAVMQFIALLGQPQGTVIALANWIQVGSLAVPWAFQIDTLSVTMVLIITGVGLLIHIYAIGYMQGDSGFVRFFVYLNLFLTAMLILVLANNYLMMFVGWEGVGLCSYLLIGFWFDKGEDGTGNARAGRKAFIVNRIGDFGLIIAMILVFWQFGTLTFSEVFAQAEAMLAVGAPVAVAITLLLLLGATGKSAQIPLFIWLPDAMAGPTPVSAFIHAATMVTAGIYMIARSHVLFALAPVSQLTVALIGATTALLAATSAMGQFDIKRVLAYSTISQLGFMVAAVGLGGYVAGIFHLATHAFFKALLFLAAGSVIHGLEHGQEASIEHPAGSNRQPLITSNLQDMRLMGGLRRQMPLTFGVYLVGALSLAGLPPLAGFFSKDEILANAFQQNIAVYTLLTMAAFFTAFYMGRQIWLIFFGQSRSVAAENAGESKPVMTIPLICLAVLAASGGSLNLPGVHSLSDWLAHSLGKGETTDLNLLVAAISTILTLLAFILAYQVYGRQPISATESDPLALRLSSLLVIFHHGWWVDEAYDVLFIRPYNRFSSFLGRADTAVSLYFDRSIVSLMRHGANLLKTTQTGQLNWNIVGIVSGLIILLLLLAIGG